MARFFLGVKSICTMLKSAKTWGKGRHNIDFPLPSLEILLTAFNWTVRFLFELLGGWGVNFKFVTAAVLLSEYIVVGWPSIKLFLVQVYSLESNLQKLMYFK